MGTVVMVPGAPFASGNGRSGEESTKEQEEHADGEHTDMVVGDTTFAVLRSRSRWSPHSSSMPVQTGGEARG